MKQSFLTLTKLLFGVIVLLASSEVVGAYDVTIDGIKYVTSSATATVTGYTSDISRDVVIPASITIDNKNYDVTKVAEKAFSNSEKLESISIPASVTEIGTTSTVSSSRVFDGCTSLKSVKFEDGEAPIKLGAFYDSSLGRGMFSGCPLEEVYLGRDIEYINYSTVNSFINYPKRYGYSAFYGQKQLRTVIIGPKVTTIRSYAFQKCTSIKLVDFGKGLTSIGSRAFEGCTNLTSAILPITVTTIGTSAFSGCSSLTYVDLGSAITIWSEAFYGAEMLSHIVMSDSLISIGDKAFANTIKLKEIELPGTLKTIGSYAFYASGLTSVSIPESVTKIDVYAFGLSALKNVTFGLSNITMGWNVFNGCINLNTVNILNNQKTIPNSCFKNCTNLQNITLEDGLEIIEDQAFSNCAKLESISIPASVTQMGTTTSEGTSYRVFNGCTSLRSVKFEDGEAPIKLGAFYDSSFGRGMFSGCPLEEVYLGRDIEYINYSTVNSFSTYPKRYGYSAFYGQKQLRTLTIGPLVTNIPNYAFRECNGMNDLISISETPAVIRIETFSNYNANLYVPLNAESLYASAAYWNEFNERIAMLSEGDLLYVPNGENTVAVTKYPGTNPEQVIVPPTISNDGKTYTVTAVMPGAFKSCENLTLISLPSAVEEVGEYAFAYNQKLASLKFGGLKTIGKGAFRNCPSITGLTLPNSLETIGEMAFYENTGITQISFGSGLKFVDCKAFAGCRSLTAVRLPEGADSLGRSSFENCIKLTYATLGSSLSRIGDRSFYNCQSLTEVDIPGSTLNVGNSTFEKCINLTLATLNSGIQTLGENTFKDCESLLTINVPGTVTNIGNGSFDNCISLSSATFAAGPDSIRIAHFQDSPLKTLRIGRNLIYTYGETSSPFRNRTTLTRVSFTGNYVTNLYYNLFDGCSGITTITLPSTLKIINDRVFNNCTGLSTIVLPEGVLEIGEYCFKNCTALTSIVVPEGVIEVGAYCFEDCRSLASASLPTTLSELETYLFHNCTALESIQMQEGVKKIKSRCFDNCNMLAGISIPSTTLEIEDYCFDKCLSLKELTFVDGAEPIALASKSSMFKDCPLETLFIGRNIDYTETDKEKVPFYNQDKLDSVVISNKEGVTYLRDYFLDDASVLPSLDIPDNIETIGKYAFANCSGLESINLSGGLSILNEGLLQNDVKLKALIIPGAVKTIDKYVIANCTSLGTLRLADSSEPVRIEISAANKGMCATTALETLYIGRDMDYDAVANSGYSPFYGLKLLKNISFTDKGYVTRCNDYYLNGCSAVETLNLPESLNTIGNRAFMDMTSLNYCRMYNNVVSVGQYGFANDEALTDLVFSTNVDTLRNNLFQNCSSLPKFTVHPKVKRIEDNAFINTTALSTLSFTESSELLNIGRRNEKGSYASMFADSPVQSLYLSRWLIYNIDDESYSPFYGQESLTDLRFGETLGDIGKYLFEKCTSLESADIPGVESIGEKAFYNCSLLKDLTLNEGTRSIGERTFAECANLQNVKLPSSVVSVSDGCFENDIKLTTLDLGTSLEIIGPSAFSGCSSLQELVIPKTLYGLGVESFKGCTSLPYLTIPSGSRLSSIGARAFQGCTGIEWVSLSEKITSLGANSFDGCGNIRYVKSYNPIPPVGLPNFSQSVLDNATVFAPAEAVADYQDADVWWEFFDIRALDNGVFVSYLNIAQESANMKATDTFQIIAEAGPAEASNTGIGYLSDNMEVATVDHSGLITAVSVGDANIKVYAKDGSGYYKICKVTVVPTLMESISVNSDEINLRVNRNTRLNAEIYPATTTNQEIIWRSSNSNVAVVDETGMVTAVYDGTATITATAADGSGVVGKCIVNVLPPMAGDSNDDDNLTITDAVNTANYAMGISCEVFNFRAADINSDNRITISDASGAVAELLNQELPTVAARRMIRGIEAVDCDVVNIADYSLAAGMTTTVEVKLENTVDYVALQADIVVPEGMTIVGVEAGERAESNHSLMQRRINDRTMRIALFDVNNTPFADNDESLIRIIVKANTSDCGDIMMTNILASDAKANEFMLTSIGGHNAGTSGIGSVYGDGSISVEASAEGVNIYNADGMEARVYTVDGLLLAKFTVEGNVAAHKLSTGVYVIAVDNVTAKIMVK